MSGWPPTVLLFTALAAAGCGGKEWPTGSATATMFGPDGRLDGWTTSVVEGIHVHALQPEQPCVAAGMNEYLSAASGTMPEPRLDMKQMSSSLDARMESMVATSNGPAFGGPDRTVLALRRIQGDGLVLESLLVEFPRLRRDEKERLFKAGELKAVYSRPARSPVARLARGWVRAVRLDAGGTDYELFLVLRPERPEAGSESIQIITRVEWPPR
jgi:hypothetical protein